MGNHLENRPLDRRDDGSSFELDFGQCDTSLGDFDIDGLLSLLNACFDAVEFDLGICCPNSSSFSIMRSFAR